MNALSVSPAVPTSTKLLHDVFLSMVPQIERHARGVFRGARCAHMLQEFVAEVVGLCWKWFVRLCERGVDATRFPTALARYAARAVNSGRRVCGQEKAKDVLSSTAQRRHGFTIERLPVGTRTSCKDLYGKPHGQQLHEFEERLQDNRVTPVPEQAAFRIDFPAWLQRLTPRERRIIRAMLQNERTKDLARAFDLSPSRISQMRREFQQDWQRFQGETTPAARAAR